MSRWRAWSAECLCGWFRDNYGAFGDAKAGVKQHATKSKCGGTSATIRDYGADGVIQYTEVIEYA